MLSKAEGERRKAKVMAKAKAAKRQSGKAAQKRGGGGARGVDCAGLHEFCRGLAGATVDVKWGADLIWSVAGKMFVGFHETENGGPGLPLAFRCSDEDFDRLTELPGIIPAPYAARFGWVSVQEKSALSQAETKRLIGESYRLVVEKLPRRVREGIRK